MASSEQLSALYDKLSVEAKTNFDIWFRKSSFSEYRPELEAMISDNNVTAIEDAFYRSIPFGTGGRRGRMGAGPNRINNFTIGQSASAVAALAHASMGNYSREISEIFHTEAPTVVIAYDTRHNSKEYAELTACVMAYNGVQAILFDGPRSTPELSFAVRACKATFGVVISASHNPPSDNGFKVYDSSGAQITPEAIKFITAHMEEVGQRKVFMLTWDAAFQRGLVSVVGPHIDYAYIDSTASTAITRANDISVAYSPLHGVGSTSVLPALKKLGVTNIVCVNNDYDGDFPSVPGNLPNPESIQAMQSVIDVAIENDCDIVFATDPDADRLGVAVKGNDGSYVRLNGQQIGVLLCWHILSNKSRIGVLPENAIVMRTSVTTPLIDKICEHFGVKPINNLLVGFKYIGKILSMIAPDRFVFAAEESHGYLSNPEVRDKDAANAAVLFAEMAAGAKSNNKTVLDLLDGIYETFGYYQERLETIDFPGKDGMENIKMIMSSFRENPPSNIGVFGVSGMIDRSNRMPVSDPYTCKEFPGISEETDNLLIFNTLNMCADAFGDMDDYGQVSLRPSGTEPKLKIYYSLRVPPQTGIISEQSRVTPLQAVEVGLDTMHQDMTRRITVLLEQENERS